MSDAQFPADAHERSRTRWRAAPPNEGLTWGRRVSGDAFIEKAASYGAFGDQRTVLEIGPGYGRLLRGCQDQSQPFRRYVAVDISEKNVTYLAREFARNDVAVVHGDVETIELDDRFDTVISSLTLKHLYPSFLAALRNVRRYLNPGALVIFDLVEGSLSEFAPVDEVTFSRWYSREEVAELLKEVPLALVAFDAVEHAPDFRRLLVVARNPD